MDRIVLELAKENELNDLLDIQKSAFKQLFIKYQDFETSPYNEDIETILYRFHMEDSFYFFIKDKNKKIGFIRVVFDGNNSKARISPIAILPNHENKGYGKATIIAIEQKFSAVKEWHLDTIAEENKLIDFYLNLGYKILPKSEKIKEGMNLSFFNKIF